MSSTAFAHPFRIDLGPSRRLLLFFVVAYTGACLCVVGAALPLLVVWATIVTAAVDFARVAVVHARRRHRRSVASLVWATPEEWRVIRRGGQEQAARLYRGSYVSPLLVVLLLGPPQALGRWPVIIVPDMLDPDTFRRLRVLLKLRTRQAS